MNGSSGLSYDHHFNLNDNRILVEKTRQPDIFSPVLVSRLRRYTSFFSRKQIRFLDVGCGTGILGTRLLDEFSTLSRDVQAVLIDPLAEALTASKAHYERVKDKLEQKHSICFSRVRFEEFAYQIDSNQKKKFNFVLLSHVLYYLVDWFSVVRKTISLLEPGGAACFVIKEEEGVGAFCVRKQILSFIGVDPSENLQTSRDFRNILTALDVPFFEESLDYDASIDIRNGNLAAARRAAVRILRFIMHLPLDTMISKSAEIASMVNSYLDRNTTEHEIRIPMKDCFFWCRSD